MSIPWRSKAGLALLSTLLACGLGGVAGSLAQTPSPPQAQQGLQKLYILNCGEGVAGDVSRWSPAMPAGQQMAFVDNCYLLQHAKGWLLWDTGLNDTVASLPDGQRPQDPRGLHWKRPRTLVGQLAELGLQPADIAWVAISHGHPDHSGNAHLFPGARILVQSAEHDAPTPFGQMLTARTSAEVLRLNGDHDVFGDGSVRLIATPGHTLGHQSLLLKLPHSGAILLSGDVAHFQANWEGRVVPSLNADKEKSLASMQRVAELLQTEQAQLWINHDKAQRERLKLSPQFYD